MQSKLSPIWNRLKESRSRPVRTSRFVLPGLLVGIGSLSLYLSHATLLSGDERFYFNSAALLSKSIVAVAHMEPVSLAALLDRIVDYGWFTPGMSIVLTPVQLLFGGDAPICTVRAYMTIVNLLLLWLIVRELLKLGVARTYAYLSIVVPCAVPYYLFYLGMLWGDLVGIHLALLVLLHLERRILHSKTGSVLSTKESLVVGLSLGVTALVRPQYSILLFIVVVRIVFQKLRSREDTSSYRGSWVSVLKTSLWITLSVVIVLAPWNYELNKKFGRSFMVTSTYLSPLFRDDDFARTAMQEIGLPVKYYAVHIKVAADARTGWRSFREQADIESGKLPKSSMPERLRTIQESMSTYYFSENQFLKKFLGIQKAEAKFSGTLGQGLLWLNTLSWYLVLSLGLLAFCVPAFPQDDHGYLLPLSIKGLAFLLTTQPLSIGGHGRYYVALIPVLVLLVLLALRASPRAMLSEWRRCSVHNGLIVVGQIFALLYGAANVWIFMAY